MIHHDTSPTSEYQVKKSKVKVTGSKSAKSRRETAVRRRLVALWRRSTRRHCTAGVSYALYRVPRL